jgi:ribosomal-protein-alanine N-acetyltransferase
MNRDMREDDLEQILILEKELFTSCWKEEDYLYELNDNPYSTLRVIEENNEIIAYGGVWCLFDQAQITTIGVAKKYQGKGYSKILMDELIKIAVENNCDTISLEVRISNFKAISLYQNYGFININTRKNYYADNNEDAYLMMKGIGGIVDVSDISN